MCLLSCNDIIFFILEKKHYRFNSHVFMLNLRIFLETNYYSNG